MVAKQFNKTKIALVGYKLAKGGLERVFSTVSEMLHESDYEVHVIILENEIEYPYYGTVVNLGFYSKFRKYFKFRKYLKTHHFDYVIDFRHRLNPWMELLFIHYIYFGIKFIYTIHSRKVETYVTSNKWIAKQMLKNAYHIVAVSIALIEIINREYQFEKVVFIPNSFSNKRTEIDCLPAALSFQYCIAVGRLVSLKQFDKLIEAYCKSSLPNKEIHLVLVGEGEEKENLQKQIERLQMTSFIHILGFQINAIHYIKNAKFLVLTSKYEGFPMVILESLHSGTPVISFDCETGPSELVINEFNGLLVENQNFLELQESLNRMVFDKQLYEYCKTNAKQSVVSFSNEKIAIKWLELLN